jgi:DNA repair exonuclease SbcCD ATPase subunit
MKIRAIRLREVGRFREPVALEGLSGGLDVLAGPNELGKSTILKAVNAALFEQHRSKHRKLEMLRPYGGGAPLIEVDFDAAGGQWRVRKQFLSSPGAELRDLRTGTVTARGADAEGRLAELLGGAGHHALLCIGQGTPLNTVDPLDTGGATFMAAIESEVESVADGSAARFVAERVKAELGNLVTSHNPPRPTGALKAALDEHAGLVKQRDDAQQRLERAQMRLESLERLRADLSKLTDADAAQARQEAVVSARRTFADASEAREKAKTAAAAVTACERQLRAAREVLDAVERRIDDLTRREAEAADIAPRVADCESRAAASAAAALQARAAHNALTGTIKALERDRQAIARSEKLAELAQRLEIAAAAEAERAELTAVLANNMADEKLLQAARRETENIVRIEARLTAAAPRVSLAYAPGAAGKVKVDGRPLADGELLHPTRPLKLEIAGIGVITIAPGQSDNLADDEATIATHRDRLAELLHRAGAGTLEAAERLCAERRDIEARLADAATRLKSSAREGLERLQRAHDELAAITASAVLPLPEELEAQAQEAMHALAVAETQLAAAERADRDTRDELTAVRTRATGLNADIAKLAADIGPPEERASLQAEKRAAFADARSALNVAVLEAAAWRDKAPDETHFAEMKHATERADAALEKARADFVGLQREEARLAGELSMDRSDDVEARLDELNGLCARAEARCRELQNEADALQLLMHELDAAATRTRDRFAKPVVERLAPYLQLILPDARLVLGEDLAPQALERGSVKEDFTRLSGGTQEQLGLLVRLAFARLLADTGTPAPLIIDDSVANTDDDRLVRVFQALAHAAQSHQVLVLTCRERDFASLGGARIALTSWDAARAAA